MTGQCDKKPSGCSQCSRANIVCPLYPQPTNLLVHNQTRHTIKRAAQQYLSKPDTATSSPLSTSLALSYEARAKNFFIVEYIDQTSPCLFSYMQVFRPPSPDCFPLLSTVVKAVFLAFFATSNGSDCALNSAREAYGSALAITRSTILVPGKATLDTTLVAILLLSVFERLTGSAQPNTVTQAGHLRAALELVAIRAPNQFHEKIGLTMFFQLNESICITSLANETGVPVQVYALRQRAIQHGVDTSSMRWRFSEILLEYANLASCVRLGLCLRETLVWARKLDSELENLLKYCDVSDNNNPQPFSLDAGRFSSHSTQSRRNAILLLRILLAQMQQEQQIRPEVTPMPIAQPLSDQVSQNTLSCSSQLWSAIETLDISALPSVYAATVFLYLLVLRAVGSLPKAILDLISDRMRSIQRLKLSASQISAVEQLSNTHPLSNRIWKVWLAISREELFY
ncbi:hypothetical protein BJY04DRAFT_223831 [Aspergillus karnatakaensis]|uniref:uncharacterized protein n=1 Tax=Aspergillus karnatakaensis TaxID=1810916 RepID=UPI003CCE3993